MVYRHAHGSASSVVVCKAAADRDLPFSSPALEFGCEDVGFSPAAGTGNAATPTDRTEPCRPFHRTALWGRIGWVGLGGSAA
eukprot:6334529-Prymnesium_polylepis.1